MSRSIRVFHRGMPESCLLPARQQVVQVEEVVNFAKVKRAMRRLRSVAPEGWRMYIKITQCYLSQQVYA